MIWKILRTLLLKDIVKALLVGLNRCFTRPVTTNLKDIKRSNGFRNEFTIDKSKCIHCGLCEGNCPNGSIKLVPIEGPVIDQNKCCCCRICAKACPRSAIQIKPRRTSN